MIHTIVSHSEQDTQEIGRRLARCLPNGVTVGLNGTLGAGKTRLVQAIASECGIEDGLVVSPTFTLCNEYQGDRTLYHLDLYRIKDEDEWIELGVEEYFDAAGLTLIEWSSRFAQLLPDERIDIEIEVEDSHRRTIRFDSNSAELMNSIVREFDDWPRE